MGNKYSIYKNKEIENQLMAIYDNQMKQWPVPYESRYISTRYGKVHVIISGNESLPPVILLHASAMGGWSWLYNIEAINRYYRSYCIDTIGDAGRSVLKDINNYPTDGPALAGLYKEIMDSLNIQRADFIGASQGGYISTNIALYAPERVNKVILSGPMGYAGTNMSVLRILFTTMFPIKPIRESATLWAFGNDPAINKIVSDWFPLILEGVISRQARPQPFTQEQLKNNPTPILLILGGRDALVGNPSAAIDLVKGIPNIHTTILETGHLISAEKPEEFNKLVLDFLAKK